MSDLGPFVAAALRDRTVQELMDENNRLREELRNQKDGLMFRITGENGAPVYYEEMVTNGKSVGHFRWELNVSPISIGGEEITGITVPWKEYTNGLEFRLGEVVIRRHDEVIRRYDEVLSEGVYRKGGPLEDITFKLKTSRPLKDITSKMKSLTPEVERLLRLHPYDDFAMESMSPFLRDLMNLHGVEEMKRMLNSVDLELLIHNVTFSITHLRMFIGAAAFNHYEDEGDY